MSAPSQHTNDAYLAFEFLNEIGIIEQLSSNRFQRLLPEGLSVAGFTVLNHFVRLQKQEDSPANLARAFQVTKGAMTNTLARLEALGLIDVKGDPSDGRAKRVSMTEAGFKMRNNILALLEPELNFILARIGAENLAKALPVLRETRTLLDENR
jgi:DNA-binding MarR family transcriptional regulator